MSVRLDLFPIDHVHENPDGTLWGYSHTVIRLPEGLEDLIELIGDLPSNELLPDGHNITSIVGARITYGPLEGEPTHGVLTTDCMFEPYRWVTAGDLARVLRKFFPKHPTTAYIAAMKPTDRVVLDWRY